TGLAVEHTGNISEGLDNIFRKADEPPSAPSQARPSRPASRDGARPYGDGSVRTPDAKFASPKGQSPPGTSASREFAELLSNNGMNVVGQELRLKGPLGARRLDIVVESGGKLYGIEIKSGSASLTAYQRFTDMWITYFGAPGPGS